MPKRRRKLVVTLALPFVIAFAVAAVYLERLFHIDAKASQGKRLR